MRLPHPPSGASRFWAKVTEFTCECPKCGKVLHARTHGNPSRRKSRFPYWDPRTGRLECPQPNGGCGKVFVVGLILWPVRVGIGPRVVAPRDSVPNERQLAQLRAMAEQGPGGAGWWMPQAMAKGITRPDDTNITASCSCKPGTENTLSQDINCPIHGDGVPAPVVRPFVDDEGKPI
jgi:hypothetical protein